jgi:hypothetical protein
MRRTMLCISVALTLVAAACGSGASTGAPTGAPTDSAPISSSAPSAPAFATPIDTAPNPTASPTIEPPTPSAATSAAPIDQATPDLAAIKPCSLFPVSEANTVSGVGYLPGKASTSGAGLTCTYADLSAHKSVAFDVQVGSSTATAQQAYAAAALKASSFAVTQVSGVGDGAFISRIDQLGIESTTIYVLTGYYLVAISTISVPPGPSDTTLEAESALIVGRLR